MIPLHLKKQICMVDGCMLDSIIAFVIIILMFIATIVVGYGQNRSKDDR